MAHVTAVGEGTTQQGEKGSSEKEKWSDDLKRDVSPKLAFPVATEYGHAAELRIGNVK